MGIQKLMPGFTEQPVSSTNMARVAMPPPNFLDLECVVRDWAWRKYDQTATRKQRRLRDKQNRKNEPYIGLEIDWSDVEFKDTTTWSRLADDDFKDTGATSTLAAEKGSAEGGDGNSNHVTAPPNQLQAAAVDNSDVNVLFQTEFANHTRREQTYTMRIDKTTSSICSTEVEQGLTKGFEMSVTLKLPGDVMEANAGFSREVALTETQGQTFEETLSWGAESEIKVEPGHIADAQLMVKEKKQSGSFVIDSRIRGTVCVNFTNLRENNCLLKPISGDIAYVVERFLDLKRKTGDVMSFVNVTDDMVTVRSTGTCRFRYGIKQEVVVNQKKV